MFKILTTLICTMLPLADYAIASHSNNHDSIFQSGGQVTSNSAQNIDNGVSQPINSDTANGNILISPDRNYFVGRIKGRQLWCAMERVTDENLSAWRKYAFIQRDFGDARVSSMLNPRGGSLHEGSDHFSLVLSEVSHTDNEMWVAYIMDTPQLAYDHLKLNDYTSEFLCRYIGDKEYMPHKNQFAKSLKIFVTAVTSPKAKFYSNLGICKAIESIWAKESNLAVDLLSFTAKVMLLNNEERRFMLNAPAPVMGTLLCKKVNHVYFDTKEYVEYYKSIDDNSGLTEFMARNDKIVSRANIQRKAEKALKSINKKINSMDCQQRLLSLYQMDEKAKRYLEASPVGFAVSPTKVDKVITDILKREYLRSKGGRCYQGYLDHIQDIDAFLEDHPAILSFGLNPNSISIYDPQQRDKVWLVVKESDADYNWIFTRTFQPATHLTRMIAVDIKELSRAGELDQAH